MVRTKKSKPDEQEEKKKKKFLLLILLACFSFAAAVLAGYAFLALTGNPNGESGSTIVEIAPDEGEDSGSVDASLRYKGFATLNSDEGVIELDFANPAKSRKSLTIDIVANVNGKDVVLATTDRIQPGHKIVTVKANSGQTIEKGNYQGKFVVHFYGDNNKEEIVNSEIEIKVYVK